MKINAEIKYGKVEADLLGSRIMGNRVIVVCSKTVWAKSYLSQQISLLEDKYQIKVYNHIRPDAPFSDLQLVIENHKDNPPETIIGIGGGSVIDACKALSVCFGEHSLTDMFYGRSPLPSFSINLIAIPTTAGTGAELSFGAILLDDTANFKGGLRGEVLQPKTVLIDGELYQSAPSKLIAEVGFDSLTHAIETYLSKKSNPVLKYQSVSAVKTVFKHLVKAVEGNIDSLQKMAICSAMMGVNLAYSSTCLPHRIQYVIGPLTQSSHAQGLIALYKGWLKHIAENSEKSGINELQKDLGLAFDLNSEISNLKKELDIEYNLSTLGMNEDQIEYVVENVTGSLGNDPSYEGENTIREILKNSF